MRRLWLLFVVAGCAHVAPKERPPAERAVTTAADLQGTWVTSDDLDWSYRLTIAAAGTLTETIDRDKMGRCDQHATLAPAGDHLFAIAYDKNSCHAEYVGATLQFKIGSFTGDALNVTLFGDGVEERRRYTRAPVQPQ